MGRLATDDSVETGAFGRHHLDSLSEEHVPPPSSEGKEEDSPLFIDRTDDETDLVEVCIEDDSAPGSVPVRFDDHAPESIVGNRPEVSDLAPDDVPHLAFGAGGTGGKGEFLEQLDAGHCCLLSAGREDTVSAHHVKAKPQSRRTGQRFPSLSVPLPTSRR